jgi:hypothetical protein
MSQLSDYLVCSRTLIEKWAAALEQQDEHLLLMIEAELPRFITLKNLGFDVVNILARCVDGG